MRLYTEICNKREAKMKDNNFIDDDDPRIHSVSVSVITDFDMNEEELLETVIEDESVPILPVQNVVIFPGIYMPVILNRHLSIRLVRDAHRLGDYIGVVCQKQVETEDPLPDEIYSYGTICQVMRIIDMPGNQVTVILRAIRRFELGEITSSTPYMYGNITQLKEDVSDTKTPEFEVLFGTVRDHFLKYIHYTGAFSGEHLSFIFQKNPTPLYTINFISSNVPFTRDEKIELLKIDSLAARTFRLLQILSREVQLSELKETIQARARVDITRQQRDYFLQQQIKTIQEELGTTGQTDDVEELRKKAMKIHWNSEAEEYFSKELNRLDRMHPQSPEYSTQLVYLQTYLSLPWGLYTKDNLNLVNAEKVLNKDHYGLEKVKERILEHLAVLKLKGDMKSPIICLYGPPGVGKTSLGRSIAAALKRKYIRMSLGGVHDEAEIRGHRKTYIGAMPGRIIKGLIKAQSSNPVFILDESDTLGSDHEGDPASALLEVLDPEQNFAFHDNYLDIDYDLSKVLFIATANNLNTIPLPLLDRMELIEVTGYITEEKVEIARRHLLPKELEANGLKKGDVKMPNETLETIIESYTRESGVRELEKKISKVLRKVARRYATDGVIEQKKMMPADLTAFLGIPEYTRDKYQGNGYAGVVTGLAWTAVGGEILFIETSLSRGKGERLTLTGNLGDVMKESAMLALEYIKAHLYLLDIPEEVFENWNIHVHVPEGAIPKDGPSAGITMATSIASALTQRKVRANLAMTGEITLRGKVLPVGGIKEKILAAKRAGIEDIMLSADNKRDIDDIPEMYLKGLNFHYVKDVKEVFAFALTDEKVKGAIDLHTHKEKKAE
jgi:ATP-dependent Lon protease